jgi:hypothetical protein
MCRERATSKNIQQHPLQRDWDEQLPHETVATQAGRDEHTLDVNVG